MLNLTKLRERKNQNFDGEVHLLCEELDALLAVVELADQLVGGNERMRAALESLQASWATRWEDQ